MRRRRGWEEARKLDTSHSLEKPRRVQLEQEEVKEDDQMMCIGLTGIRPFMKVNAVHGAHDSMMKLMMM